MRRYRTILHYREVGYEFTFVEKGGNTRFVMKVTPDEKGLSKKILEKIILPDK